MQDGSKISNQPERQRWGTRGTAGALFAGRLTFENVSCTIGTAEILKNLSFELQAGEITLHATHPYLGTRNVTLRSTAVQAEPF